MSLPPPDGAEIRRTRAAVAAAAVRAANEELPEGGASTPPRETELGFDRHLSPNPGGPIDPATFQQTMYDMMALLTQAVANRDRGRSVQTSTSTSEAKEPKIKDPETYHGSRDGLNAFITECQLVFELQPSRFPDDRTKVSYMISLLRGTPLLAIRPLLETTPRQSMFEDNSLFVKYLRLNYGDPDERGTARRKLDSLRQISSASAYFAELQQHLAVLGWQDQ